MSSVETCRLQDFLNRNKNPLKKLKNDFGINHYKHPDFPLVGFKHDPNNRNPSNSHEREACGVVFEHKASSWKLIAKGPNQAQLVRSSLLDWDSWGRTFPCAAKEDGTTMLVFFYENEWLVNTTTSFGLEKIEGYSGNWQDLFWEVTGSLRGALRRANQHNTYVFELCTPVNEKVRKYTKPSAFLTSVSSVNRQYAEVQEYWKKDDVRSFADQINAKMTDYHSLRLNSMTDMKNILHELEKADPSCAGLILINRYGKRYDFETETYTILSRYGKKILAPTSLINIIRNGEDSKVIKARPEIASALAEVSTALDSALTELSEVWLANREIKKQKDFAAKVMEHPFFFLLFQLRKKNGVKGTVDQLKKLWEGTDSTKIADRLFGKKAFKFCEPEETLEEEVAEVIAEINEEATIGEEAEVDLVAEIAAEVEVPF